MIIHDLIQLSYKCKLSDAIGAQVSTVSHCSPRTVSCCSARVSITSDTGNLIRTVSEDSSVMYSDLSRVYATVMFSYTHLGSLWMSLTEWMDQDRVRSRFFVMGWRCNARLVSRPCLLGVCLLCAQLCCYNTGTTQRWVTCGWTVKCHKINKHRF